MKKRDIPSIFLFQVLTLGFYFLYWCWRSKNEVNAANGTEEAPTIWWFILPGGGYWWAWKYSQAVEKATKGKVKFSDAFLYYILATVGVATWFWWPTLTDGNNHIRWMATLGIWVGAWFVFWLMAAIFPAAMQNRFNKLAKK